MKSSLSFSSWTAFLGGTALLAACAGGMNISGKTPIVGTIRLDPTASCPVPAAPTATTTAAPTATHATAGKK